MTRRETTTTKAEETRERIVDAALTLFHDKGFDETRNQARVYWALTHPPKFVEKLAFNILSGLVADCRRRQIDPVKRLSNEPYWTD